MHFKLSCLRDFSQLSAHSAQVNRAPWRGEVNSLYTFARTRIARARIVKTAWFTNLTHMHILTFANKHTHTTIGAYVAHAYLCVMFVFMLCVHVYISDRTDLRFLNADTRLALVLAASRININSATKTETATMRTDDRRDRYLSVCVCVCWVYACLPVYTVSSLLVYGFCHIYYTYLYGYKHNVIYK